MAPDINILNPANDSIVSGMVAVQIQASDDNDPAGTLTVDWNVDGGAWQSTSYNAAGDFYGAELGFEHSSRWRPHYKCPRHRQHRQNRQR